MVYRLGLPVECKIVSIQSPKLNTEFIRWTQKAAGGGEGGGGAVETSGSGTLMESQISRSPLGCKTEGECGKAGEEGADHV